MILMTKEIELKARNIKKAHDKKYCFETYESILSSIFDFDCVSNLKFDKDQDGFTIRCTLKVSKSADMLWILIKEFMSCIKQTEEQVELEISEREQDGIGVTYKLYAYTPLVHPIEK
jgi:hypothetical protein